MKLSRLRVRLASTFAVAFLAVLALLQLILYAYLHTQFSRHFSQLLQAESQELAVAITNELHEGGTLSRAAHSVLDEWPARDFGLAVLDASGTVIATGGSQRLRSLMSRPAVPDNRTVWDAPSDR